MSALPDEVAKFMETYGVLADEVWAVRPGTYAVKHRALERVAMECKIAQREFKVLMLDLEKKIAAVEVCASLGEQTVRTTGEAAPYNNKNGYPLAMSEKRAWDRAYLKLLQAHGAIYSEDEAEDFKQGTNGRPAQLAKKDAREIYSKMQSEIRELRTREQGRQWAEANAGRKAMMPDDWQDTLELQFQEQMLDLKQREVA